MDFNTSLRRAIKTGNVILGQNETRTCIEEQKAELVVMASNCPAAFRSVIEGKENIPLHIYEGSSVQLGRACGKPFMVSALAVVEPGESDILSLVR